MHFIDDVDLEAVTRWRVPGAFDDLPDLFDAIVGGAVDLQDVETRAGGDLHTSRTLATGGGGGPGGAVQCFGENSGGRRLAHAANTGEKEGVRRAVLLDGVSKRPGDRFLADDFFENFRSPLEG